MLSNFTAVAAVRVGDFTRQIEDLTDLTLQNIHFLVNKYKRISMVAKDCLGNPPAQQMQTSDVSGFVLVCDS